MRSLLIAVISSLLVACLPADEDKRLIKECYDVYPYKVCVEGDFEKVFTTWGDLHLEEENEIGTTYVVFGVNPDHVKKHYKEEEAREKLGSEEGEQYLADFYTAVEGMPLLYEAVVYPAGDTYVIRVISAIKADMDELYSQVIASLETKSKP